MRANSAPLFAPSPALSSKAALSASPAPALAAGVQRPDHVADDEPAALAVDWLESGSPSLRVAVVTETYPPEINGVALTLSRLVQGLVDRRHRIQLIRPRQPTDATEGMPAGVPMSAPLSVPAPVLAALPSSDPPEGAPVLVRGIPIPKYPGLRMGVPSKRTLIRLWTAERPDLVHIATEGPLGWSALQAARQLRLPVSSDYRTNFHAYSQHYGAGLLMRSILRVLRSFHNRAQLTMVPTAALQGQLVAAGFQRVAVVGRGVDGQRFHPGRRRSDLRSAWQADDTTPVFLLLGRLAPEKNWGVAIDAWEAARLHRPEARLVVVGDGPQRAALQARCPEAHFLGMLRGEALAEAIASADIFLFPSETETFGNVVTEAMASGLAVIAYRLAAAAEVVHTERNGVVVEPGNRAAFSAAAVRLACQLPVARGLGARAAADMAALDWPNITRQVEALWLQLLQQRPDTALPSRFSRPSWAVRS